MRKVEGNGVKELSWCKNCVRKLLHSEMWCYRRLSLGGSSPSCELTLIYKKDKKGIS